MPLKMNIISGAEIRSKSKSGMTSDQIAKELLNSPTRDEVKPSEVAQLKAENEKLAEQLKSYEEVMMNIGDFMAPDEPEDYMWTHHGPEGIRDNLQRFIETQKFDNDKLEEQLNRYPEGAAGYTGDEFDELVSVMDDIENHPDYDQDERFECGYEAGQNSVEIADEKDDEIEKNKKELLEQLERITDLKVQNEKLKEDNKKHKQRSERQKEIIEELELKLQYECGDEFDMEGFNEYLERICDKAEYKKWYDYFEFADYDVEFIKSEE